MQIKVHCKIQKQTKMVIFNFKGKEFEGHLNGKRLYPTESTKNLVLKFIQILFGNIMLMIFP